MTDYFLLILPNFKYFFGGVLSFLFFIFMYLAAEETGRYHDGIRITRNMKIVFIAALLCGFFAAITPTRAQVERMLEIRMLSVK